MTPFQKIIKYGAIAFATYLIVIIITVAVAIIGGIFASSKFIDLYKDKSNTSIEDRLDRHNTSYDYYDNDDYYDYY